MSFTATICIFLVALISLQSVYSTVTKDSQDKPKCLIEDDMMFPCTLKCQNGYKNFGSIRGCVAPLVCCLPFEPGSRDSVREFKKRILKMKEQLTSSYDDEY